MSRLERMFLKCPVLYSSQVKEYYPEPSSERLFLLSLQCNDCPKNSQVSCSIRENLRGEKYIEVIFYDEEKFYPQSYRRFVIMHDFMMEEDVEEEFLWMCKEEKLSIDYSDFVYFQENVSEYIPDISIRAYEPDEIGSYLLRLYFSTHRSGAKEILYKSSLENIADMLDRIEDYNLIGSSPECIMGIPTKLLRILNQPELVSRSLTEESRNKAEKIYRSYSSYFGKQKLPSAFQWMYLEEVSENGHSKFAFEKKIYHRIGECKDYFVFQYMLKFAELKVKLGWYNPYKKIPRDRDVYDAVMKMQAIEEYIENMDEINLSIARNNYHFALENDEFIVVIPTTAIEFINESINQDNCLMGYIKQVVRGETNIVFIRRKDRPDESYVTMEISGRCIVQIKARFNDLPERGVFEFAEKLALKYCLDYNPEYIITYDDDYEILEDREDLQEYIEEFHMRYDWPKFPDDGIRGEQLCLWQCFPDCFTREQARELENWQEQRRLMELWCTE